MTPEPSAWTKFTWHLVDITVTVVSNTISAAIVAAVAWFTWELKNRRETESLLERDEKLARQAETRERRREICDLTRQLLTFNGLFPSMLEDLQNLAVNVAADRLSAEEPFRGYLVWWTSAESQVMRLAPILDETSKTALWLELKGHIGRMHEAIKKIREV